MYDDKDQEIEDLRLLVATYDIQLDRYENALRQLREEIQILSSEVTRLHDIEHQLYESSKSTPKIPVKSLPSRIDKDKTNTLCMNCNGVGYHAVPIKTNDNNKVPYTQYGYMTCEMCNGQGSL